MYLANLGVPGGSDLEKLVRDYKKSHRRISDNAVTLHFVFGFLLQF